jgi:hypothetical protein
METTLTKIKNLERIYVGGYGEWLDERLDLPATAIGG